MQAIRRILVGIKDPGAKSMPAVAKAAQLARASGAEIELFHGLSQSVVIDAVSGGAKGLRDYEQSQLTATLEALEKVAVQLRRHDITVRVSAVWDYPASEAIVRRAMRSKADLIVIERHAGAHTASFLLSYTDWDLLRLAETPVLIVKTRKPYRHPGIFAAVDPMHAHAKPARLDLEILKSAAGLKTLLRGKLTVFHACPIPMVVTGGWMGGPVVLPGTSQKAIEQAARQSLEEELERLPMPPHKIDVVCAPAHEAIPAAARRAAAGIAVMGVMSRSGLKRVFIGNTAETVLDALPCDVLVVKPGRFQSGIDHQVRGPQLISIPTTFVT